MGASKKKNKKMKKKKSIRGSKNVKVDEPDAVRVSVIRKVTGSKRRHEDNSDCEDTFRREKTKKIKLNEAKNNRTIFVGNVPLDTKKSRVLNLFDQYGPVEKMSYRCPPIYKQDDADTDLSKRTGIVCHVCYVYKASVPEALQLHGYELDGYKLRVDLAVNTRDNEKSVFVGNLAYDTEENVLREHFKSCGTIENIHIVQNGTTGLGKGIAYVRFLSTESTEEALKLTNSKLKGRQIRVKKVEPKQKNKKKCIL